MNIKMTNQVAFTKLIEALSSIYDKRESETIARYVLEDVFKITFPIQNRLFTEEEVVLFEKVKQRLLTSEPWQYVIGQADFYGLKFNVNSSVLIPRPETEELVYRIIQDHKKKKNIKILDIGTGSGCIPITLKKELPQATIFAIDVSKNALNVARTNAKLNDVAVHFQQLDILNEENWNTLARFDVIVSNPPYIPMNEKSQMRDNVLKFEPEIALFVENDDPLLFYRTIARFSKSHLLPSGKLYFEINEHYGQATLDMLNQLGMKNNLLEKDMFGKERMTISSW